MQHHEQRVAVFLDLRALVPVARVLHRQLVQVELRLHLGQLLLRRIGQRHPDEAARPLQVIADLPLVDIRELLAVLVGDAVDQHGTA